MEIDFEGEFGVIVDAVPMGVKPEEGAAHIRLVVQINDWSLREITSIEFKLVSAGCRVSRRASVAPFAITPDELGADWRDGRVCAELLVEWNGDRFGWSMVMKWDFPSLNSSPMPHALAIWCGTIIRLRDHLEQRLCHAGLGLHCREARHRDHRPRQARHVLHGLGDRVRMEAQTGDGRNPFGRIEQIVTRA